MYSSKKMQGMSNKKGQAVFLLSMHLTSFEIILPRFCLMYQLVGLMAFILIPRTIF